MLLASCSNVGGGTHTHLTFTDGAAVGTAANWFTSGTEERFCTTPECNVPAPYYREPRPIAAFGDPFKFAVSLEYGIEL